MSRALLIGCAVVLAAAAEVHIERYGRPVQCDGFLMEWREEDSKEFGSLSSWSWDMVNTPDALAGYVRYAPGDTCRPVSARIMANVAGRSESALDISFDKSWSGDSICYELSGTHEADSAITAEFTIPWSRLEIDPAGGYDVWLQAVTSCGDTAQAHAIGNRLTPSERIMTPRLWVQIVVVALLLTAYLVLQAKLLKRRRNRRTE
jgi:hypothetical protein